MSQGNEYGIQNMKNHVCVINYNKVEDSKVQYSTVQYSTANCEVCFNIIEYITITNKKSQNKNEYNSFYLDVFYNIDTKYLTQDVKENLE